MIVDLTLQDKHLRVLRTELLRPDGLEHAAYVLFGVSRIAADPFTGSARMRLTVRDILPVEQCEICSADAQHISWKTIRFVQLLGQAAREGCQLGIAHSHPAGPRHFSEQDDRNEADLTRLAQNRNGADTLLASLLLAGDGTLCARLWTDPARHLEVTTIRSVGSHWRTLATPDTLDINASIDAEAMARQSLALGAAFNRTLSRLRVGVVGAGGTGSPLIQQLARMGVGHIAIFDPDHVERSNLNRLYGATREDADLASRKVDVARREVERMGLGTRVATYRDWIGSEGCRDALKSLDILFGCTDDHDGRGLINRLAYYYLIPVIDIGLALRATSRHGEPRLDADGRVTVLEPGASCLICRRIVDPAMAAEEALQRTDPAEYARRKAEAYVRGAGDPAPAVISFTTSVATMAIEEMIQRLQGFRGSDGAIANRVRRFGFVEDVRPGAGRQPCRICGSDRVHGAGDVEPFLGRVG
ncbi:ThiF family adenylyltransferase [Novosphingobium flavum]|uniref:ThiF family adenylyltransferase n=1 Tax=Novosphingobium aerophilum TaxID=2839843 RepID=UPI00163ADD6F|nr:ThiF family adenylyltransferase [Novosphingobium aerophilum]MBC2662796.1 ThiF family adenylyltransferase [Novosphingobium aerophilum]